MKWISIIFLIFLFFLFGEKEVIISGNDTYNIDDLNLSIPAVYLNRYYAPRKVISLRFSYPGLWPIFSYSKDSIWMSIYPNKRRGKIPPERISQSISPYCKPHPRPKIDTLTTDNESNPKFNLKIHDSPGSLKNTIYYIPKEKVVGLECIRCIEDTTCKLVAISSQGISYEATSNYPHLVEEWMVAYKIIDDFFREHTI